MVFVRLLGLGAIYGLGFALIKSLFPSPILLLVFQGEGGSEGGFAQLVSVYMGVGILAGVLAAPAFGGLLIARSGSRGNEGPASLSLRFVLSMGLALLMGLISGLLTLGAYAWGILPGGGVLDTLSFIQSSRFAPGTPMLVAWSIARDLLPAGLAGLFLAPLGGGPLFRLYTGESKPVQKDYGQYEDA